MGSDEKQRIPSRTGQKSGQPGPSIQVDVELPVTEPPETLYHGTAQRFAASIEARDCFPKAACMFIFPGSRNRGKSWAPAWRPVIYLVDAGQMHRDGYCFYLSANGVWLTRWSLLRT